MNFFFYEKKKMGKEETYIVSCVDFVELNATITSFTHIRMILKFPKRVKKYQL